MRYIRGHAMTGRYRPIADRFWKRVRISGDADCWEWTGGRKLDGYGVVGFMGKRVSAHRVAFILAHGTIPDGAMICHTCDNPPCCNPAHLYAGNAHDNVMDAVCRGRHFPQPGAVMRFPPVHRGEANNKAKLTEEDVQQIRELYGSGIGATEISRRYGITRENVYNIVKRFTWAHVK